MLRLVDAIASMTESGRSTAHAQAALKDAQRTLRQLDTYADEWIKENIPRAYQRGWQDAFSPTLQLPGDYGDEIQYDQFARLHRDAIAVAANNARDRFQDATRLIGRQANDIYRKIGVKATQERLITGEALATTTARMREDFMRQGITGFTDRAGRNWSIDSYAEMVARTTTREATVSGTVNRALAGKHELIQISEHEPTCELCAPLQGKVYSLRGTDKRYPAWEDFVPVHPSCIHVVWVYVERFDPNAEKTRERSNTSLTKDPRTPQQRAAYDATQKAKAAKRSLREQYKRYKARLGDDAGRIQDFARKKKAGGDAWQDLQKKYREAL